MIDTAALVNGTWMLSIDVRQPWVGDCFRCGLIGAGMTHPQNVLALKYRVHNFARTFGMPRCSPNNNAESDATL